MPQRETLRQMLARVRGQKAPPPLPRRITDDLFSSQHSTSAAENSNRSEVCYKIVPREEYHDPFDLAGGILGGGHGFPAAAAENIMGDDQQVQRQQQQQQHPSQHTRRVTFSPSVNRQRQQQQQQLLDGNQNSSSSSRQRQRRQQQSQPQQNLLEQGKCPDQFSRLFHYEQSEDQYVVPADEAMQFERQRRARQADLVVEDSDDDDDDEGEIPEKDNGTDDDDDDGNDNNDHDEKEQHRKKIDSKKNATKSTSTTAAAECMSADGQQKQEQLHNKKKNSNQDTFLPLDEDAFAFCPGFNNPPAIVPAVENTKNGRKSGSTRSSAAEIDLLNPLQQQQQQQQQQNDGRNPSKRRSSNGGSFVHFGPFGDIYADSKNYNMTQEEFLQHVKKENESQEQLQQQQHSVGGGMIDFGMQIEQAMQEQAENEGRRSSTAKSRRSAIEEDDDEDAGGGGADFEFVMNNGNRHSRRNSGRGKLPRDTVQSNPYANQQQQQRSSARRRRIPCWGGDDGVPPTAEDGSSDGDDGPPDPYAMFNPLAELEKAQREQQAQAQSVIRDSDAAMQDTLRQMGQQQLIQKQQEEQRRLDEEKAKEANSSVPDAMRQGTGIDPDQYCLFEASLGRGAAVSGSRNFSKNHPGSTLVRQLAGAMWYQHDKWLDASEEEAQRRKKMLEQRQQQNAAAEPPAHQSSPSSANVDGNLKWQPDCRFEVEGFSIVSTSGGHHIHHHLLQQQQQQQLLRSATAAGSFAATADSMTAIAPAVATSSNAAAAADAFKHHVDQLLGTKGCNTLLGYHVLLHCRRVSWNMMCSTRANSASAKVPVRGTLSVINGCINTHKLARACTGKHPLVLYSSDPLFEMQDPSDPYVAHWISGFAIVESQSPFINKVLCKSDEGALQHGSAASLGATPGGVSQQQQQQNHRVGGRFRYPAQQQPIQSIGGGGGGGGGGGPVPPMSLQDRSPTESRDPTQQRIKSASGTPGRNQQQQQQQLQQHKRATNVAAGWLPVETGKVNEAYLKFKKNQLEGKLPTAPRQISPSPAAASNNKNNLNQKQQDSEHDEDDV